MQTGVTRWRRSISALAVLAAAASAAACTFYTDGINGRPVAVITVQTPGPHYLTQEIRFTASTSDDPGGTRKGLVAQWRAYYCDDPQGSSCPDELDQDDGTIFETFTIAPLEKRPIKVTLTVRDERGAIDVDTQMVDITNRDPTLSLQLQGYELSGAYPMGTWIDVLAQSTDPDGDTPSFTWELFPPDGATSGNYGWGPVSDYQVPAYRLEPDVPGLWNVRVTVDDGDGGMLQQTVPILVVDDAPPCISSIEPAVPGGTYILGADEPPRRFGVQTVNDDLDSYPPPADPGDFLGAATFRWLVASPDTGGAFVEVSGLEAADYLVDPAGFAPGDRLSIRVEVADRIDRTLPCDDTKDTCSIGNDGCLQRVTWGVEIR